MAFHELRLPDKYSRGAIGGHGWQTRVLEAISGHERRNIDWSRDRGRWNISHLIKTPGDMAEMDAWHKNRRGRAHGFRYKSWTDFAAVGSLLGVGDGANDVFQLRKVYADLIEGTAQAGGVATITLQASHPEYVLHEVDDTYNTKTISITGGTGAGQKAIIPDYVGATRVATVLPAWGTVPDATSKYAIELFAYNRDAFKPVKDTITVYVDGSSTTFTVDLTTGIVTITGGTPAADAIVSADFEFDEAVRFDVDLPQITFASINSRNWPGIILVNTRDIV